MKTIKNYIQLTMKTRIALFALISLGILKASAQENNSTSGAARQMSLTEAIKFASENSYKAKYSKAEIEKARQKIWETTAIGLPQINAEGTFNKNIDIPVQVVPAEFFGGQPGQFANVKFGVDYNMTGGITASQLLFDGGYLVGLRASKAYKTLVEMQDSKNNIDIKDAVSQAYFNVLIAEESQKTTDSTLLVFEKLLSETKALNETGFLEETDVDQLTITKETVQNLNENLKKQIILAKYLLKLTMGLDMETDLQLTDNLQGLVSNLAIPDYETAKFELSNHPDYKIFSSSLMMTKLDWDLSRSSNLPSLSTFITHQQNAFSNSFSFFEKGQAWFPTTIWGVRLTVPILSSGNRWAAAKQKKIEFEKMKLQEKEVEQSLKIQSEKAKFDLLNAQNTYISEQGSLNLAKKIVRKTSIKYTEGLSSSLDLSTVQNQYLQKQTAYFNSLINLLNAKLAYDKAYGKINN